MTELERMHTCNEHHTGRNTRFLQGSGSKPWCPEHPDVELAEGTPSGCGLRKPALAFSRTHCSLLKEPMQERLEKLDDMKRRALTVIKTFEEDIKIKLIRKTEQKKKKKT